MELSEEISEEVSAAFEAAKKARLNAYAPYSKYLVGASIKRVGQEKIFAGCNVENSSFGATICAERTAILSANAELGAGEIEFLVLVTDNEDLASPCGMCLQVISEFAHAETPIYVANLAGVQKKLCLKDFLPKAFSKEKLPAFQ